MTKWLITHTKTSKPWKLVTFPGPAGSESRGIVDILAIRKDHRSTMAPLKRGDLFEIILIQVKGGVARWPTRNDLVRLQSVAAYYKAQAIVLGIWVKGERLELYRLTALPHEGSSTREAWERTEPKRIFGT